MIYIYHFKFIFQDELQLLVTGMALGLGEPAKFSTTNKKFISHSLSKDLSRGMDLLLIFSLKYDYYCY